MKQFRRFGIIGFALVTLVLMMGITMLGCPTSSSTKYETRDPVAEDYEYVSTQFTQVAGSVEAIIIEPKTGKSPGKVTVNYDTSTTPPQEVGDYEVTINVAAITDGKIKWNEAKGLKIGTLIVNPVGGKNPASTDFRVDPLTQSVDRLSAVTVTPIDSTKSKGEVTIWYAGSGTTSYTRSTTLPSALGTYRVTFDIKRDGDWNAANGIDGNWILTIIEAGSSNIPIRDHFNIPNFPAQLAGSVTAVPAITAKSGYTTGTITVRYTGPGINGATTPPQTAGTYAVTFDVTASTGWTAATSLYAGVLIVNLQTPVVGDFDVLPASLAQFAGSVQPITITPKAGKSNGVITRHYAGTDGTTYPPSGTLNTVIPQAPGKYLVTFDVAIDPGLWDAGTGFSAGVLEVTQNTPDANDFEYSNLTQTFGGTIVQVGITPKTGKSDGTLIRYYTAEGTTFASNTTIPSAKGKYTVTFDVAPSNNGYWKAVTGLTAGTLEINDNKTPVVGDYDISTNLSQRYGDAVTIVTATPKSGKSPGVTTVYYEKITTPASQKTTTKPRDVGEYKITFDVAGPIKDTSGDTWNEAKNLDPNKTLVLFDAVKTEVIEIDWSDKANEITVSAANTTITTTGSAVIRMVSGSTVPTQVMKWYLNGVAQSITTDTYTFSSSVKGTYIISVLVKREITTTPANTTLGTAAVVEVRLYNAEVKITVN